MRRTHGLGTRPRRALYALRKQTAEPVFGIVEQVVGWRRVSLRGLAHAAGECTLAALVWNVEPLHPRRAV
ncbi:MAG: transposase [Betaproteobacteria bacterium]